MFEHRGEPLLTREAFFRRLAASVGVGILILGLSLFAGMAIYHHYERLSWLDAFLNASMILSGMGPLHNPVSVGGKFWAGVYALYSGLAMIAVAGISFAPLIHRALHRFHLDEDGD